MQETRAGLLLKIIGGRFFSIYQRMLRIDFKTQFQYRQQHDKSAESAQSKPARAFTLLESKLELQAKGMNSVHINNSLFLAGVILLPLA